MTQVRLRLTKIDELQFLTCLRHGVWGSRTDRLKRWEEGDYLAFLIGREIAGLAIVSGPAFFSTDNLWVDDLYPFRIPILFKHAAPRERRLTMSQGIRDTLTQGRFYGLLILTQRAVTGEQAMSVVEQILAVPNELSLLKEDLDRRLAEAHARRKASGLG